MTLIFLLGLLGAIILTVVVSANQIDNATSPPESAMITVRVTSVRCKELAGLAKDSGDRSQDSGGEIRIIREYTELLLDLKLIYCY